MALRPLTRSSGWRHSREHSDAIPHGEEAQELSGNDGDSFNEAHARRIFGHLYEQAGGAVDGAGVRTSFSNQRSTYEPDKQEVRSGMDSYCVSTERGVTVYGCLRGVQLTGACSPWSSRPRTRKSCTSRRPWRHAKKKGRNRNAGPPVHDDLVRRDFTADAPNVKWLTDITEHPTALGKLYLCAIKDCYSNKVVGYSIDSRMKSSLALAALRNAITLRDPAGAIVHSDRGSQFRSKPYRRQLRNNGLTGSMGRVGACGDNAAMESFFSLLQKNVLDTRCWAYTVTVTRPAVTRLARFLESPRVNATSLADVDRVMLERYLADLATDARATRSRSRDISSLGAFLDAIRRHEWDTSLPASAAFYPDDFPKPEKRLPRGLAEHIMAQVERSANLDRWHNPESRLLTVLLMRCGLRVGDASRIAFDCVVRDGDGAPYLRYTNRKMKREALVPIDEEVEQAIIEQQQQILRRWPASSPWLFPAPKMNPDGRKPLTTHSYRGQLRDWLGHCDVRDEHGRSVHLTPHQWRHTFGTRLINRDVPQEVVRVLLDHSSGEMTAHYARLHDTTVRRHWEAARKVNAKGDTVTIDPAGPLAEANWAKQRLGRVTQALPNGFCGLPVQKTCPHANACLTCPMFVTTPEFLPQHREHRQQVLQIITAAEARGQQRLAEMNQQVLGNLDNIIITLEAGPGPEDEEAADAS